MPDNHEAVAERRAVRREGERSAQDTTNTDSPGSEHDPTAAAADQAASEIEQAASDRAQVASDEDQAADDQDQADDDEDQAVADRDQATDDREQASSDREQAAHVPGRNPAFETEFRRHHEDARVVRQETTSDREDATQERATAGFERSSDALRRDEHATLRDLTAEVRDRAAEDRDQAIAEYQQAVGSNGNGGVAAAKTRAEAAVDRARAAEDRESAAEDRREAARLRERLEYELENAQLDDLTGFYLRGLGKAMLQREIDRSRRSDGRMVLAYIDVDGLKRVNDEEGHDAGDRLLVNVAAAIRSRLRSYDPVVRMGGDEFVCIVSETDLEVGRGVVRAIRRGLTERQEGASITVGLAALEPDDSLDTLCARADAGLRATKAA